ncbi:MAG: hypothetical protein JWR26_4848 [Pedosphaera sp.]|nr:hypothetical protein [Pedosphaera sp.]
MNLSAHPELLCVRFDIPCPLAQQFTSDHDNVSSRHRMEKVLQAHFYKIELEAYVFCGSGPIEAGHIFIQTDCPAAVLAELMQLFRYDFTESNLISFVHLGWKDEADNLWRTFYPETTRPFWTLFKPQEEIEQIMQKGRSLRS